MNAHTFIPNLSDLIESIQADSIISRTVYKDDHVKAILFGFDTGQALSEHTASQAAIIHILRGEATLTLGDETYEVGPDAWIHMQPHEKHSIHANSPLVMLLLLMSQVA